MLELGETARTSNGRDGVQVRRVSLSENQGHGVCGTGGRGPSDVEGCSDRDGLWERVDREWILGRCQGRESRENEVRVLHFEGWLFLLSIMNVMLIDRRSYRCVWFRAAKE